MILVFTLTMPSPPTVSGKWSGEDDIHAKVVNLGRSKYAIEKGQKILDEGPYWYRWSDGWSACVEVREVDGVESRRIRKKTRGFTGRDWMIESIRLHGKIYADHEIPKKEATHGNEQVGH